MDHNLLSCYYLFQFVSSILCLLPTISTHLICLAAQCNTMARSNFGSPVLKCESTSVKLFPVFELTIAPPSQIIGLIILGIVLALGGGPHNDRIGFRYWMDSFKAFREPPVVCLAFFSTFANAAFSFLGTEIVALAAAEAENSRRNVPKAVGRVFYRILLFYVGGIVIGMLVPFHDDRLLGASTAAALHPHLSLSPSIMLGSRYFLLSSTLPS